MFQVTLLQDGTASVSKECGMMASAKPSWTSMRVRNKFSFGFFCCCCCLFVCLFLVFLSFEGSTPRHREVPRRGVYSEL